MHHASSDVIGSQGVESQSHYSMHDVYLQFPVYFTTILFMQSIGTNVFYFHMKMDRVYKDYVFITEDMSKLLKSYKALS